MRFRQPFNHEFFCYSVTIYSILNSTLNVNEFIGGKRRDVLGKSKTAKSMGTHSSLSEEGDATKKELMMEC